MNKKMVQLDGILTLTLACQAHADLNNCEDLYVGRIWVEKGHGLRAVVLLASPAAAGGSYWAYFADWTADEKKSALATLTAAKRAGHRVHVQTTEANQCGITLGGTHLKAVFLATNP